MRVDIVTCIYVYCVYTQGGITPLFLAIVYFPEVSSALLAKEQDLNKRDKVHFYPVFFHSLSFIKELCLCQHGETALIVACKAKNLKVGQTLLELKADPNIANNVCLPFPPS